MFMMLTFIDFMWFMNLMYFMYILHVVHIVNILYARALMAESTGFQSCYLGEDSLGKRLQTRNTNFHFVNILQVCERHLKFP